MRLRGTTGVVVVIGALAMTTAAGFGQEEPAAPPAGEAAPDAGTVGPDVPDGRSSPVAPTLPAVPPGMGLGGRDCESERTPGVGV